MEAGKVLNWVIAIIIIAMIVAIIYVFYRGFRSVTGVFAGVGKIPQDIAKGISDVGAGIQQQISASVGAIGKASSDIQQTVQQNISQTQQQISNLVQEGQKKLNELGSGAWF